MSRTAARRLTKNYVAERSLLRATITALLLGSATTAEAKFIQINSLTAASPGARGGSSEILAYTPDDNYTVLSTVAESGSSFGVQILSLGGDGSLTEKGFADFTSVFGADGANGLSSVAADPLGRGFGAAAIIPTANTTTLGKVALFDYRGATTDAARSLVVLDVGFHPDSVKFSADGTKLFVANEAEWNNQGGGTVNAPGSLSVIDLSGIAAIGDVPSLTAGDVADFDFTAANLGGGASLAGLRNPSVDALGASGAFNNVVPNFTTLAATDPNFFKGIEPEFMAQADDKLYVSLQENNAIGVFDLTTNKWETIHNLGTITQTVDGSDRDGPGGSEAAMIDDVVKGLPMPDSLAAYTVAGQTYLVTVNEGDARTDDRDSSRLGDTGGDNSMNNILDLGVFPADDSGIRDDAALGRLNVSRIDGDTDNDGDIDEPIMFGTRSFSIWNADTGALVFDSGSLENILLSLDPTLHNSEEGDPGEFDGRSDNKGPEPEALALGQINGRTYGFFGMERQNGLLMYDLTDPTSPVFLDYLNTIDAGLISPESLLFISAGDSPTGAALLLGGYELNGGGIGVFSIVPAPEPSSLAIWSLLGAAMFIRSRPSRKRR
jgi:hypothetical protein